MKGLFCDNRMAVVLQYFRKTPVIKISALASALGVSERTIRNDIKQINQQLKGSASIDGIQGRYSLHIFQTDVFREIYSGIIQTEEFLNSPQNREYYIFGKLMRAEGPMLADELAYEMNIGRTTFMNDLKKLRTTIEPYHLKIIGKTSKGLLLHGTESDIRSFVLEKVYDSVYGKYPLDKEITDAISQVLKAYSFEKNVRESILRFATLMLDRFLTGHYIGELSAKYFNMTARPEFAIVDELVTKLELLLHVTFPIEERLFLFLPIAGMRTPADIQNMHAIQLDEKVRLLVEEIFRRIQGEMNIIIECGEFTDEFLYHVMFMLNRLRFRVKLKNPLLEDLREKYPLSFRMAEIASMVISEGYGLEVTEDERGYLAAYFQVFLTESTLKKKKPFRIAVVCGTGRVTARLVSVQLKKILDSSAELTLFADEKVNGDILEQFDIVLTTVELSCSCSRPIIQIHEIFNERELLHKIEKAKYWNQIEIPVLDNNWFVMAGLLDESRFFVFDEKTDYMQALKQMVESLQKKGDIDEEFWERLVLREKKGTMAFDRAIAIPHALQYAGDKLILAVGVCKESFTHKKQGIKVIFLIGLPDREQEEDDLLIRVYDEIITVAQDEDLMNRIAGAKSFSSLLRVLYRQPGD